MSSQVSGSPQSAGDEQEPVLYQKRIPIVPRSVKGLFRRFKTSVLILAYSIFFLLPWIPWSRQDAPNQAVLFDLVGRRFFIFDLVIYPQDIFVLSLLLFIAATLLFFVTGLVGRAFCGYFCFQTLWTDAFIFVEHLIQGERPARLRLMKQNWNLEKILKIGGTHLVWLLIAWWTSVSFILYYAYAPDFLPRIFKGDIPGTGYTTMIVLTFSTYIAAGWAREQVCTYMCPYSRFQSVMYEAQTLVVAYEEKRGEGEKGRIAAKPGLKTREERQAKGHGDCIDCGFCVQVCPTGIDIRKGLQIQCISCGLCIDACDNIMKSLGFPKGLIRYDSEENMKSANPEKPHVKWKRLRTVGYFIAMVGMVGMLVFRLASRTDFEESVQQVRQPLFVTLSDGSLRNRYQIRITNKATHDEYYTLKVKGIPEKALDLGEIKEIHVRSGKSLMIQASVTLPPEIANKTDEFEFIIIPRSKPETRRENEAHFFSRAEH